MGGRHFTFVSDICKLSRLCFGWKREKIEYSDLFRCQDRGIGAAARYDSDVPPVVKAPSAPKKGKKSLVISD